MKERPILFSGPMVRALLRSDNQKTQTRRILKCDTPLIDIASAEDWANALADNYPRRPTIEQIQEKAEQIRGRLHPFITDAGNMIALRCPYGSPGDRLWVRESFSGPYVMEAQDGFSALPPSKWNEDCGIWYWADDDPEFGDWTKPRPSIHMPRWASRITLEITDVRVQLLKDISDADAQAEGCFFTDYGRLCFHRGGPPGDVGDCTGALETHPQRNGWMWDKTSSADQCLCSAKSAYGNLWESINGAGSWNANPWVWVIEFKILNR